MRFIVLGLFVVFLSPAASAQSKTPSGFTIRISPAEDKVETGEAQQEPRAKSNGQGLKKAKSKSKAKRKKKRRKRRSARKRSQKRPKKRAKKPTNSLVGTGAHYVRETPWGMVETASPRIAATVLARAGGSAQEDDRHIIFERGSVELSDVSRAVLGSMSDLLEVRPEIGLLLLEGHADDGGTLSDDQLISEARASAVREFLVGRGVSSSRVLAYGLGRSHAENGHSTDARKVILRLVEPDGKERTPSKQWSRAAVVRVSGQAEGTLPEEGPQWRAMAQRDEVSEDGELRTGPNSQMLLRLPDATTVLMGSDTELKLENLDYDFNKADAGLSMTVRRGTITLSSTPNGGLRSQTTIEHASGSVRTYSADLMLSLNELGHGTLSIRRGTAQVLLGSDRPITLGHGQRIAFDENAPSIRSTLTAPLVIRPLTGDAVSPVALSWQAVPGVETYITEVSTELDFFEVQFTETTTDVRQAYPGLVEGQSYFWRVFAIDSNGQRGASSQIHQFKVVAPPPPED